MGLKESKHESCSPAIHSSGCSVLSAQRPAPRPAKQLSARFDPKLIAVFVLLVTALGLVLFTDNSANPRVRANFSGPPAGFTHAPGELDCSDCHTTPTQSNGSIMLNVPATYTPGQTYNITVTHATTDQSRVRWGFELTGLDAADQKAGSLAPLNSLTQVLNNQGPFPSRQYIEQTTDGSFFGQHNGASWTFQWTAPADVVGVITFYVAGNQANGDGNSSGDNIYFTFAASQPAASSPPQLRLEQGASDPNQAAALDSVLLVRDPFRVLTSADWFYSGSDRNTRVMVFAANVSLNSGETSSAVTVDLTDAASQSFNNIPAEDVRAVVDSDLSQITFKLPTGLAAGTCSIKVRIHGLVSNAGTVRIVP